MGMKLFIEGRPKYSMNMVVIILSIINGILLIAVSFFEDINYLDSVIMFFQTGIPNPSVCGPLFLFWVAVCLLYITKKTKSPKLSTIVAIVYLYFGTINTISFNEFGLNWPNFIHMFQAYIGFGYFFESLILKYNLWRR
jgi:hypothetical protein